MMDKIKRIFWLWGQCFTAMGRVSTFVPFLIYALIQLGLLLSLADAVNSPLAGLYISIIRKLFSENALHYPNFFFILTPLYNQLNLVLSGIIGTIIIGVATMLFAGKFTDKTISVGQAFANTFSKYGALIVVWIIETILTLVFIIGLPYILNKFFMPDYRTGQIFELMGLILGILVVSMFAYTTALIVLNNQTIGASLSKTFKLFGKNGGTSFILVAVPSLMYFPLSYLLRKVNVIIDKFSPEMIAVLLGFGILLTLFTSYFQIGSITRLYLIQLERKRY